MDRFNLLEEYQETIQEKDIKKSGKVTKTEMKDIFKKHNLDLGFPNGATSGTTVTDWNLHYGKYKKGEKSDLEKFREIIEKDFADTYELSTSMMMSSTNVYKK